MLAKYVHNLRSSDLRKKLMKVFGADVAAFARLFICVPYVDRHIEFILRRMNKGDGRELFGKNI